MNKKIVIGSVMAVILLILVSFTNVVGFKNYESNSKINSPLFGIRTKKAIDEERIDLTCDYLDKGKESDIHLPDRDSNSYYIRKIIKKISNMNDKSILLSVQQMYQTFQDKLEDNEKYHNLIFELSQIKNNPEEFVNNLKELFY